MNKKLKNKAFLKKSRMTVVECSTVQILQILKEKQNKLAKRLWFHDYLHEKNMKTNDKKLQKNYENEW
jgi:hypothetical protein